MEGKKEGVRGREGGSLNEVGRSVGRTVHPCETAGRMRMEGAGKRGRPTAHAADQRAIRMVTISCSLSENGFAEGGGRKRRGPAEPEREKEREREGETRRWMRFSEADEMR